MTALMRCASGFPLHQTIEPADSNTSSVTSVLSGRKPFRFRVPRGVLVMGGQAVHKLHIRITGGVYYLLVDLIMASSN